MKKTADEIRVENDLSKLKAINEEIAECDKYLIQISMLESNNHSDCHLNMRFDLTGTDKYFRCDYATAVKIKLLMYEHFTQRRSSLFARASQIMKA